MITLLSGLASPLVRGGLALAGVVAFLSWFAIEQQSKGAAKVVAKIERHDNESASNIRKADSVSRGSTSGMRRLVRDPNTASE